MTVAGIDIVGLMMLLQSASVSALDNSPCWSGSKIVVLYTGERVAIRSVTVLPILGFSVNA